MNELAKDSLNQADADTRRKNVRLGWALGFFAIGTVVIAIINFYYSGLPKDANRMRERFKKRSAAEAQALSEALQTDESQQTKQLKQTSEEAK